MVVFVPGVFGAVLAFTKACTQEGGNTVAEVAGVLLPGAPLLGLGSFRLGGSRLAASLKLRVVCGCVLVGAASVHMKALTQEGGNTVAEAAGVLLPGAPV